MRTLIAVLLVLASAVPAAAKSYWAERFDTRIRLLSDGAIDVTETVVFRFEGGPFDHVFREIPRRRTDGIEVLSATMDGRPLPFGDNAGEVEVRGGSPIRVRWRFAPRSDSTHTFVLNYVARGVVKKEAGADVFEWIALPTEHAYRIDSSDITIETPGRRAATPVVETRRVSEVGTESADERIQIGARAIGKNGWVKTRMTFADGTLIAAAPLWQQRQIAAAALAPRWMIAAASIFAVGLILLFALRQGYDSPPRFATHSSSSPGDAPPDTLRPALAGALANNGSVSGEQAMAALFSLAAHGAISITEEPRSWGQRHYRLHRKAGRAPAAPEEAMLLALAFRDKEREEDSVLLPKARSRVDKGLSEFKKIVQQELQALGLWNDDRVRVRNRFAGVSLAFLLLGLALLVPGAILANRYSGWSLLIGAAVIAVAIVGFIIYGALTPLSNEGVRRAETWRAYQKHLKEIARDQGHLGGEPRSRLLPFAVALGLAAAWSKYLKQHPGDVPPWFSALAADNGAFPAFIAAGGTHGGGGAGGGGGAAGGGGSGAG